VLFVLFVTVVVFKVVRNRGFTCCFFRALSICKVEAGVCVVVPPAYCLAEFVCGSPLPILNGSASYLYFTNDHCGSHHLENELMPLYKTFLSACNQPVHRATEVSIQAFVC
jgi:hypothetical protein